jgi:dephospho-CoA kinase
VKPFTVVLTGGIGSGKSTAAAHFARLGVPVVDTDQIAHMLTAPGAQLLGDIRRQLGDGVFARDGCFDRAAARRLVFSDPNARHRLETILHPAIRAEVDRCLEHIDADYAIIVVPLFVETGGYADLARRVIVVDCDGAEQLRRVAERGTLSPEEARAILAAQAPRETRLAVADHVLDNRGDPSELARQVEALHGLISKISKTR